MSQHSGVSTNPTYLSSLFSSDVLVAPAVLLNGLRIQQSQKLTRGGWYFCEYVVKCCSLVVRHSLCNLQSHRKGVGQQN